MATVKMPKEACRTIATRFLAVTYSLAKFRRIIGDAQMHAKQAPTSTQNLPKSSRLEKTGATAPRDAKTLDHYSCGVEAERLEISVGITIFNNARFLVDAILEPLKNPVVTEVVISDDYSGVPDWHLITRSVESSVETVGGGYRLGRLINIRSDFMALPAAQRRS